MAPQNSTLIHGNAEATSPVSVEAEELSSYSPILPAAARASHRRRASPGSSSSTDGPAPPPPPPPNVTKSIASFGPYGGFRSEALLGCSSRGAKPGTHPAEGTEKGAVKRDSVCSKSQPARLSLSLSICTRKYSVSKNCSYKNA